jgi:ROS/MUCR transcriptional regulator protein
MAPRYRLPDGTPVFHPVGELRVDRDDQKVCCGLCGRWFRALGGHLGAAHGWSAYDYRVAFGLNAQRPLQAPAVSRVQATTLKRRIQTDGRIQAGMRQGVPLARSGQLNQVGRQADAERGRALERRRRTVQQGARIGRLRAARYRAERDRRARALGYADAADLFRQRYLDGDATVAELAAALDCAEITVTAEMDRLGIRRRPQDARLSQGRRARAAKRAGLRAEREARARALGFDDLASYLRARHHQQRWPRDLIAQELGVPVGAIVRLMRREGVPGLRGVKAATAHRPPTAQ